MVPFILNGIYRKVKYKEHLKKMLFIFVIIKIYGVQLTWKFIGPKYWLLGESI